ncbi:HAMP domain-containing sensor histidine kinase [Halobacillus amylolyticus]|uniref:histidine kinase n=1 Tax=Halobacillus amylolyticus TaxID=2932259 RepID=A0ABY4HAY4_9BACI|nr:HAMP domain-containing sensor histidine kinase [Halobacillus amylolyticus]UOR12038.1 HAMP domain-containing histidine kinase [Halobacillus amylolyticus]
MKNKISLKLGFLFLILMVLIELILFFVLYTNLSNQRIDEVLNGLLARGGGHRDVLENNFDPSTLAHVALMESEAMTDVVITDTRGEIIAASTELEPGMRELINLPLGNLTHHGRVIEKRWKTEPYVATLSPIKVGGELEGYVYMFSPSFIISEIISQLSNQFILVMGITLVITIVTVYILTKLITKPLIHMKEETEKLSKGETRIDLKYSHNDELGVLAQSITRLGKDLDRLKHERHEFLSSIAHELRTPLTYLKGYADIVSKPEMDSGNRQKYLTIIKEEAKHLTNMVEQLFQLARIDENSFSIQRKKQVIFPLLRQVRNRMYPLLEEKEIELYISCPDGVSIYIDETRFQQVMNNIIDNAITYSPQKSTISIRVLAEDSYVVITVTDEGPGVPEESLPYLFDRLYRLEKSRSRAYGGSGIGLAIVKEIVEVHEGRVFARNLKHGGLSIIMHWPKEEEE